MLKNRSLAFIALALTAGFAVGCDDDDDLGDDIDDEIDDRIDDLDIDDDFVVTRAEWEDAFVVFDTDDNQVLVVSEFRFNGGGFEAADVNNDGFVTEDEWDELMDDWDVDDDDLLEELEFEPFL